jgi:two-component system sensor histidine kinase ChvG
MEWGIAGWATDRQSAGMNLKRQLLLVSLLTLVLPWAGCQFIRETESALRAGQQQLLAGTARAIADTLAQYPEAFPLSRAADHLVGDQLYGHGLDTPPKIDGYFDDWGLQRDALREMRGADGPIWFAIGLVDQSVYLYVEVTDRNVVYASRSEPGGNGDSESIERVSLVSTSPPYLEETLIFTTEAPGAIVTAIKTNDGLSVEPAVTAFWQDGPRGYQLEARIPAGRLGTHLGIVVDQATTAVGTTVRSASFSARIPGALISISPDVSAIARSLVQPGMRLMITDAGGWRIAVVGDPGLAAREAGGPRAAWLRVAYDALVESGKEAELASPAGSGRERQGYIVEALDGREAQSWFRSADSGSAVVAVAEPIAVRGAVIGAVILQQGTQAILSLTNQGLARLMNVTLIATLLVAASLLGYASWLSRRIRRLSRAAEHALERDELGMTLPSSMATDEVGDLSRSFASVLRQLGDYNAYLRTLATKLSHELRTPLAIVTSSLENLEHEPLNEASAGYAARAKDGADRLRRILTAMSEASRVEEVMAHAEPEEFDLCAVLRSTCTAYQDAYPARRFVFESELSTAPTRGAPELLIQMLDKLVANAVDFSDTNATIRIALHRTSGSLQLDVANPGPPLPELMRAQLFDSMISVRKDDDRHLGLGLYIAKLIVEGHGGKITAANTVEGVVFSVLLPGM